MHLGVASASPALMTQRGESSFFTVMLLYSVLTADIVHVNLPQH